MRPNPPRSFLRRWGLVTLLIIAALSYAWYHHQLSPVNASSHDRVSVAIAKGSGVSQIADTLKEKGLIRSAFAFKIFTKLSHSETGLQAGEFTFSKSLSAEEVLQILRTGKGKESSLTIPEGYSVEQIDALLAEKGLSDAGAFLKCAQTCDLSEFSFVSKMAGLSTYGGRVEGFLYPDTYFVTAADFTPEAFLKRLLQTFQTKVLDEYTADIANSHRSVSEIVTMASLIEKEAITDEERPMIADILWKRFDAGMGLGVDASVHYAVHKPMGESLTLDDLNTNSPYNTRKFKGLPPGPIANPGLESLKAALHPQKNEYWYYLHGTDGTIHYAVTNEEHNINRNLYLK